MNKQEKATLGLLREVQKTEQVGFCLGALSRDNYAVCGMAIDQDDHLPKLLQHRASGQIFEGLTLFSPSNAEGLSGASLLGIGYVAAVSVMSLDAVAIVPGDVAQGFWGSLEDVSGDAQRIGARLFVTSVMGRSLELYPGDLDASDATKRPPHILQTVAYLQSQQVAPFTLQRS